MRPLTILFIFCCISNCTTSNEIDISKFGYKYKFHIQNEGKHPLANDTVQFHVTLVKNGKITYDTHQVGSPAEMIMRQYDKNTQLSPIEAALYGMTLGDSLSIFSKYSKDTSTLRYDVRLINIKPFR